MKSIQLAPLLVVLLFVRRTESVEPHVVPRTWDKEALDSLELPRTDPKVKPEHVSAEYYYQIPVRRLRKSTAAVACAEVVTARGFPSFRSAGVIA